MQSNSKKATNFPLLFGSCSQLEEFKRSRPINKAEKSLFSWEEKWEALIVAHAMALPVFEKGFSSCNVININWFVWAQDPMVIILALQNISTSVMICHDLQHHSSCQVGKSVKWSGAENEVVVKIWCKSLHKHGSCSVVFFLSRHRSARHLLPWKVTA